MKMQTEVILWKTLLCVNFALFVGATVMIYMRGVV